MVFCLGLGDSFRLEIEALPKFQIQKYGILPNLSDGVDSLLDLQTLLLQFRPSFQLPLDLLCSSHPLSICSIVTLQLGLFRCFRWIFYLHPRVPVFHPTCYSTQNCFFRPPIQLSRPSVWIWRWSFRLVSFFSRMRSRTTRSVLSISVCSETYPVPVFSEKNRFW